MGIDFDHVQYLSDLRLILGEATSEAEKTAPFTEAEFYRAQVDPGFAGAVKSIEADLYFERYSSAVQNVTWKWQLRSKGQTSWTDLHTAQTESWGGYALSRLRASVDASALGANDDVPLEARLVATASSAATVKVRIGTYTPSVRVTGESS
jgi:hypothetical protein